MCVRRLTRARSGGVARIPPLRRHRRPVSGYDEPFFPPPAFLHGGKGYRPLPGKMEAEGVALERGHRRYSFRSRGVDGEGGSYAGGRALWRATFGGEFLVGAHHVAAAHGGGRASFRRRQLEFHQGGPAYRGPTVREGAGLFTPPNRIHPRRASRDYSSPAFVCVRLPL